ncbi:hypothetical protein KPH14_001097 [Odynerus spinipes]|uniref:Uncharacterized protein n=1 Tax=Odynerus spinipes TaxID=1348599 RepID=A0AAD9RDN6_9HYME|nr:hypothetical protein KPH14_001097 [Odynerus spinipes]
MNDERAYSFLSDFQSSSLPIPCADDIKYISRSLRKMIDPIIVDKAAHERWKDLFGSPWSGHSLRSLAGVCSNEPDHVWREARNRKK